MICDLTNPYRRAFLIASLSEIKTEDEFMFEFLNKQFESMAEHLINLFDVHGTSIVNLWSKKKIKHLFKRHGGRNKGPLLYGQFVKLPDGTVVKTS